MLTVCRRNGSQYLLLASDTETRARIDLDGGYTYRSGACYIKFARDPNDGLPLTAEDRKSLGGINKIWRDIVQKKVIKKKAMIERARNIGPAVGDACKNYAALNMQLVDRYQNKEITQQQFTDQLKALGRSILVVGSGDTGGLDTDNDSNWHNHNHNVEESESENDKEENDDENDMDIDDEERDLVID